ncbi:hypothetical protein [Microvenator marinus]|uniref:hypothetical protein n=1 Tax=Microvenator marinus TaxID=2600177 RepID=UPI003D31449C
MLDQSDKSCAERLLIALDLAGAGIEMYRQRLRLNIELPERLSADSERNQHVEVSR